MQEEIGFKLERVDEVSFNEERKKTIFSMKKNEYNLA